MSQTVRYQAETCYDKDACDALAYLMTKRLRVWPRRILLLTGLASIVLATWYLIQSAQVTVLPLLVLLAGNLLSVFGLFARQFSAGMLLNSMGKDAQNTYLFTDDDVVVQNSTGTEHAYGYAYIRRVIRMSGYLFFIMRNGQVYLLKEANIQSKGFEAFLQERITAHKGEQTACTAHR